MNIRQAESKIITVVKSIADIFREISTFPGSFQANSARFTTAVTLDVFFFIYKSIWNIRYSERKCAPNHSLNPRGVVVLNKTYIWSISGIQYGQCNYSAQ